jgi:hypothetical protein
MYPLATYFFMSAAVTGMGCITASAVLAVVIAGAPAGRAAGRGIFRKCQRHAVVQLWGPKVAGSLSAAAMAVVAMGALAKGKAEQV